MKTSLPLSPPEPRHLPGMRAALAAIGLCGLSALAPAFATPPAAAPRAVALEVGTPGGTIADSGRGASAIVDGRQVAARTWTGGAKVAFGQTLVDFSQYGGAVLVGSSATFNGLTVFGANPTGGNETIAAVSINGDFGFSTTTCTVGAVLAAYGGTCSVNLTFTPLAAGVRTGQLTVTTDLGNFVVDLTGNAVVEPVPMLEARPTRVVFGAQQVGTVSESQFVEITNTGPDEVWFDKILTIGDFGYFSAFLPTFAMADLPVKVVTAAPAPTTRVGPAPCSFSGLPPGSTCVAEVAFKPTAVGVRDGSLYISAYVYDQFENVHFGVKRVGLVGTGQDVPVRPLSLPGTISFPQQYFGTFSDPIDFAITNNGTAMLEILPIEPTGDFFATSNCTTLAAGESCQVSTRFAPAALGLRSGQAVIRTLPDTGDYLVNLFGTGVVNPFPVLLLSKGAIGYGNSLVGAPNAVQLTITSAGQVPLSLSRIYTVGDFVQSSDCPAILQPGLKCTVTVGFLPSVLGPRHGELVVESNAFDTPSTVTLSGTACSFFSVAGGRIRTLQCQAGGF